MKDEEHQRIKKRITSLLSASRKEDSTCALPVASDPDIERKEAKALFMSLLFEPVSDEACAFTDNLVSRIILPARGPKAKIVRAVRIVASELMQCAAYGLGAYLYRPMNPNTFDASTVSYKPFRKSYTALVEQGMLAYEPGRVDFGSGIKRTATRFYPTTALVDLASSFGIEPSDFDRHFKPLPRLKKVSEPIRLRKATKHAYGAYGRKIAGDRMPVDNSDSVVAAFSQQVEEINEALADADIKCFSKKGIRVPHVGFRRSFNQGDLPGVHYNRGGRLFSEHGGYQSLSAEERSQMTIDGEPVVEWDISASHLTIAMSLLKMDVGDPSKLYTVDGIPRIIVKLYVNASLGNGKALGRWPNDAVDDYGYVETGDVDKQNRFRAAVEEEGYHWSGDLRKDWPVGRIKREVLPRFPVLHNLEAEKISWGLLQFEESCVIVDTVHELCCKFKVVALPVHDSIICKASDAGIVKDALERLFVKRFGIKPALKCRRNTK